MSDIKVVKVVHCEGSSTERYEIGGFEVVFTPWHSEYLNEDFMAVSVLNDGREVFHSGMTKLQPSEEQARNIVETMLILEKVVGE